MPPSRPSQHPLLALGLLAAFVALLFLRSGDVRENAAVARESAQAIRSDADFFRSHPLLGFEYPILRRLQADVRPGTPVSLTARGRHVARMQRFWLALLPEYPISGTARLAICPTGCERPGDRVMERGDEFVLLERGAPP